MISRVIERGSSPPLLLEYVDGEGDGSHRQIAPLALLLPDRAKLTPKNTYIWARCDTAKGLRQFRFDRIASLADARTGELLDIDAWLAALHLGEREPWRESAQVAAAAPPEPIVSEVKRRSYRAVAVALAAGYLLGRWRVIAWLLHHFHVHWGRWL